MIFDPDERRDERPQLIRTEHGWRPLVRPVLRVNQMPALLDVAKKEQARED